MKFIGALLIIIAGTLIGFHKAHQLVERPRQIRQLIHALQRLETEIMYGFTPLAEAFSHICSQISEPLASMFKAAAELLTAHRGATTAQSWQTAVDEVWNRTSMKSAERDATIRLGYTLGVSDREDQIKHLRLAVSVLQGEEQTATEEQKRYEKMWKSLGLLAGALVAIMMY